MDDPSAPTRDNVVAEVANKGYIPRTKIVSVKKGVKIWTGEGDNLAVSGGEIR